MKVEKITNANASLENANLKYSSIKNNFEIILNNDSMIQECKDSVYLDLLNIEIIYKNISEYLSVGSIFNTIGICYEIKGIEEITAKNKGKQYTKRDTHKQFWY